MIDLRREHRTAGEAKRPRKDLPPATRFMYWVPLSLYFLGSLCVGFNINFADPDLFQPYSLINTNASHSPFIIVVKSTAIKVLPNFLNACFLISGYSAACVYTIPSRLSVILMIIF